jgi:NTP pyrophosphatase (non-canonical NTP hydrolase)
MNLGSMIEDNVNVHVIMEAITKMDFNEYQKKAHETAQYNGNSAVYGGSIQDELFDDKYIFDVIDNYAYRVYAPLYPFLKLAQEASEVTEPILKIHFRGDKKEIFIDDLEKELGDVLWYISECATVLGLTLEEVAKINLHKLSDRAKRNVIKGSGDNR